jgi:hypothetical protein
MTGLAEAHLYRPGMGPVAHLTLGLHPGAGFPAGGDFHAGNCTGQKPGTDTQQIESNQPQEQK